jgi:hypothetical protein
MKYIQQYQPGLYKRITALRKLAEDTKNPWHDYTAFVLFRLAYGKTLEWMVNNALQHHPITEGYFEHLGGANQADWKSIHGVLYDLTTESAAGIHLKRFYGEKMRIVTYDPPWKYWK